MKTFTEEDLRKAFQAGVDWGMQYVSGTMDALDEDEYIESLQSEPIEEETISFTYSFLRRKLDWMEFCELTGVSEYALRDGYEIKDYEIFIISESKAKQFNLF